MEKEAEQEILEILEKNKEELIHAKNTLNWLLIMSPGADDVMRISALGHDIERVVYGKDKTKYSSHKEFKLAHSKRSTEIVQRILLKYMNESNVKRARNMILNHEFGGDYESNLIKDADSLANFQWCDEMFGKIEEEQIRETAKRMYKRMEEKNRAIIHQIHFKNPEIKEWALSQKT